MLCEQIRTHIHTQCACLCVPEPAESCNFMTFHFHAWVSMAHWVFISFTVHTKRIYLIQLCRWFDFMVRVWDLGPENSPSSMCRFMPVVVDWKCTILMGEKAFEFSWLKFKQHKLCNYINMLAHFMDDETNMLYMVASMGKSECMLFKRQLIFRCFFLSVYVFLFVASSSPRVLLEFCICVSKSRILRLISPPLQAAHQPYIY